MAVDHLNNDAYRAYLEHVDEGADALTHRALICYHDQTEAPSHCKIYWPAKSRRGLVNEVVGQLLARAMGFVVPPRAAILVADARTLRSAYPSVDWAAHPSGKYPLWCVETLDGSSPKQLFFPQALPLLQKDLKRWKQLPAAVAFDAWVANVDRNLGNLIRLGPKRYALIDHGRICTGAHWHPAQLNAKRYDHRNVLCEAAWATPMPPEDQRSAVIAASQHWRAAFDQAEAGLSVWLPKLLDSRSGEDSALMQYLRQRAYDGASDLSHRFGMLPL